MSPLILDRRMERVCKIEKVFYLLKEIQCIYLYLIYFIFKLFNFKEKEKVEFFLEMTKVIYSIHYRSKLTLTTKCMRIIEKLKKASKSPPNPIGPNLNETLLPNK